MKITVKTKKASFTFDADQHESLLYAGLRQGLKLPYECATGTCGSCRARLSSGDIQPGWPEAPGRSYLKPQRDEFLLCQARAQSDCEIRVPGNLTQDQDLAPSHYAGTISGVQRLTHDVLRFEINLPEPINYHAGQFVVLESPHVDGYRAYSMTNFEQQTQRLAFVIKCLPGGKFSDWITAATAADSPVAVFGPLGSASFHPQEAQNLLCIAGGSGIAGMMSMFAHGCRDNYFADHRGQLFFGVRRREDSFFLPELVRFAEQFPDTLKISIAFSDETDITPDRDLPPNVVFTTGLVHKAAQENDLSGDNSIAYIAGPPPMVDAALRDLMLEAGFPADRIRYDKFA